MMKPAGLLAGVGLSLAMSFAISGPAFAEDPSAATVVATVNGTEITLGHMVVLRESLPAQYQSLPDDVLFKGILDQLIQQTALEQSVGEPGLRDKLALENDRRGYLSGVALQDVVAAAVTDEALQTAYDARFKDAQPETEYSAAHILVESEEKANELKAQIEAGADFGELAKANSTDVGSGANGGALGWFGKGMMVKPFEEAVMAAEVGKVSGPVQSQFGWHLILVGETRIAAAPSLDDMRDELASEIEKAAVDARIQEVTGKAEVTRPGEGLDPALLRDATLVAK